MGTSACLSIGSLCFAICLLLRANPIRSGFVLDVSAGWLNRLLLAPALFGSPVLIASIGAVALSAVGIALIWDFDELPLAVAIALQGIFLLYHIVNRHVNLPVQRVLQLAVIVGVCWDYIAIICLRRLLRWQALRMQARSIYAAAIAELLIAAAAVGLPVVVGSFVFDAKGTIGSGVMLSAATNTFTIILGLSFAISAALLIAHRMTWPALARPLYRLATMGIFATAARRAGILAVGCGAIAAALNGSGDILSALRRLLVAA